MDKNALEEAVRIKEKHGAKVTVLSVGSIKLKETILQALAIGADEASIIVDPACDGSGPGSTALTIAAAVKKIGSPDLILFGEGSTDNYSGQVYARVAEILDLPQVTYVRELTVENGAVTAVRDRENALDVVKSNMPLVVSVTSEINKPRRPPLTQILRASRKPMNVWTLSDLGISSDTVSSVESSVRVISNLAPEQERKGIIFQDDVNEAAGKLIQALRKEGVFT
jgi:electron transfer flavoprotein beta subunit